MKINVYGYEKFLEYVSKIQKGNKTPIFMLFSGDKLDNGDSWCPDCVQAEPVIENVFNKMLSSKDSDFVHVYVGDRKTWKDANCSFRRDKQVYLKVLPTILRWGTQMRLEGADCEKEHLLELMFGEEAD